MKSIKQHQKAGWEYKGEQHNGYAKGRGVLRKNNIVHDGKFEKGYMIEGVVANTATNKVIADGKFNINGDIIEGELYDYPAKLKYQGTFRNKKLHGPNGKVWILEDEGKLCIESKGTFVDGDIIEGIFYMYSTKLKAEGTFRTGRLHGPNGKISSINNDNTLTIRAEGNFVDGRLTGHGKVLENDGKLYEGNFENLKLNGQGSLSYTAANGSKFILRGNFKNNMLNDNQGSITATAPNGSTYKYEGEIKNNMEHGQGKTWTNDILIFEGIYNNKMYSNGKLYLLNSIYEGDFSKSNAEPPYLNGKGIIIRNIDGDKHKYVGMLKEQNYHGYGKYSKNSRTIHLGKWKNGCPKSNPYFCSFCNKKSNVKFKTCAECRLVVYCDKQCQSKDWKCHKDLCKFIGDFHSKKNHI